MHRLRGKKFTPQVPRDELLSRTSDALRDHGVDHHSQAVLMSAIGNEVLNSENPIFIPIHPHPKYRDSLAWKRSYAIVLKFLQENHMDLTYEMIKSEYPEFSESLFGSTNFIKKLTLTQFLSEKIKKSTNIGFNKRVAAFVQGKPPTRPSYTPPPSVKPEIPKSQPQQQSKSSTTKQSTNDSKKTVITSELKPFPKPQKTSSPPKQTSQQNATKSSPKPNLSPKQQQTNQQKFKEQKNLAPLEVNGTFKKPSIRDLKNIPSPQTSFSPDSFNYTDSPKNDKNSSIAVDDDFDDDFDEQNSNDAKKDEKGKSESQADDDFVEVSETQQSEHEDTVADDFVDEGTESEANKSQAHQSETDDFVDVESKTQSSEAKKESGIDDDFDDIESEASKSQSQTHQSETDDFIDVESKTQSSEAKKESGIDDDFDEVESEASKSQSASQVHQSETDEFIDIESKTQSSTSKKESDDDKNDDDDFIDIDEEASTKKESEGSMIEVINDEESNIQSNSNATSTIDDSSIAIQSTIKSEISDYESISQKEADSGIEIEFEDNSKSDINVSVEEFDD